MSERKILIVGDVHIKVQSPGGRLDNYYKAIMGKLIDVLDIAEKESVDLVIFTGDIFSSKSVPYNLVKKVKDYLGLFACRVLIAPGNHDVYNGLLSHIKYNAIGLIGEEYILTEEAKFLFDGVWIEGADNLYELDKDVSNYDFKTPLTGDIFRIKVVHGAMVGKGETFFGDYTPIDSLVGKIRQDLTIAGHIHGGIHYNDEGRQKFIRAGSICRNNKTDKRDRIEVGILHLDKNAVTGFTVRELKSAKPFEDVYFADDSVEFKDEFVEGLKEYGGIGECAIPEIVGKIFDKRLYNKFMALWEKVED